MNNTSDFLIENGVLKQYRGYGSESVTIPAGVTVIGYGAFRYHIGITEVILPEAVTSIHGEAFYGCSELRSVTILGTLQEIGCKAFNGCDSLTEIVSPLTPHPLWRKCGLGMQAARGYISHYTEYLDSSIAGGYISYLLPQRKRLLPVIFSNDAAAILEVLADQGKITGNNYEQDYLQPAVHSGAKKCVEFLEKLGSEMNIGKEMTDEISGANPLWDGVHFSFDGKTLLQYSGEPGQQVYYIPEGTKEIRKGAIPVDVLKAIYIPDSVTRIFDKAFDFRPYCRNVLFISIPDISLPAKFICGPGTVYVASANKELANALCKDSYEFGYRRMVYTGGPLTDLPPKTRKYAVQGFLYAEQNRLVDMSSWRKSYFDHIRRNQKTYVKYALEDEFLLRLMLDEALITDAGATALLEAAEGEDRVELKAEVLAYRDKHLGKKAPRDDMSFADSDRDIKRRTAMDERREQIKNQKGITGLAFVSSGTFENFGRYNYYTDVYDLSDLKAFIQARGGFYRGAVSSKTDYLLCNDPDSQSTKCRKAMELGVPIITEDEFMKMVRETE